MSAAATVTVSDELLPDGRRIARVLGAEVLLWCCSLCCVQVVMRVGQHVGPDGVARVCGLCLALVTLSQGVPFIHAGDDLLRSKSLDRDSYNSGK